MQNRKDINLYLFYEFGVEGDEDQVSEHWPFELRNVGSMEACNAKSDVYEFANDGETYYAFDLDGLTFCPVEGLSLEQLQLQEEGSRWIGAHELVDLNTVRISDDAVPRTPERRSAILELASRSLGTQVENIRIVEGLFLKQGQTYLALVEQT